jgi:hypothetical protein
MTTKTPRPTAAAYDPSVTKSTGDDWLGAPALAKEFGITLRTMYQDPRHR